VEFTSDHVPDAVPATIDRELTMIQAAIALVASNGAPRVVLSGLRFVESLIEPASRLASEAGVRVTPLWTAAEHPTDLAVERLEP
jgi:hypothetical protein